MLDLILPVALFAFSMSITPGPNNVMVTASGANFGYRRTIPHLLGIGLGYPAMVAGVGFGLGGVFEAVPAVHVVLKYAGSGAILWMAWRIATASGTGPATERPGRPFTFLQAAAFQWVNPKGWVVAVGAVSAFTTVEGDLFLEVGAITLSFVSVNYACASVWTVFGVGIGRLLKHRNRLRIFNVATGLLLVAAIVPLFID
ncbi:MAG: LysE family translocator [Acidobacteriota bacterium]|nr:LysE family translocator [Acidobacteriota bacterium]